MAKKLPYWEHPLCDPCEDLASGYRQQEILRPLTSDLDYAVLSECICYIDRNSHDADLVRYSFNDDSVVEFSSVCRSKNYVNPGELLYSAFT